MHYNLNRLFCTFNITLVKRSHKLLQISIPVAKKCNCDAEYILVKKKNNNE